MGMRKGIPGAKCSPLCAIKEKLNALWDRAAGCVNQVNDVTPDGSGKFEIRGGTGIQITDISNGIEINSTAIGAGIATINNTTPDSNNNFTIGGASGRNGVTVTDTAHGVNLSIGDFVSTINNVTSDVFGNLDLTAGSNITITPDSNNSSIEVALSSSPSVSGMEINGDLEVNGDIIQSGSAYETHAEQVYTKDDYIIMRDGAIAGLATGDYAGFQVKKYDGTNDGRLAIDKDGTARVGDVGDEQPLLTRSESADLTNGNLLKWDSTGYKAIDSGKKVSDFVNGSGNIGSDTKPVKVVNGVATPVTTDLVKSGNWTGNKWKIQSGYATIRVQSNTSHSVFVSLPNVAPNSMFPIVQNTYNGSAWADIQFNVTTRNTSGFQINSWINAQNIDITTDVFWMAMVPDST